MINFIYIGLLIAGLYKIFEKVGIPAWYACIPGLNGWYVAKLGGVSIFTSILAVLFSIFEVLWMIPVFSNLLFSTQESTIGMASIFFLISYAGFARASYFIAKSFGKGFWFSQGTAIFGFIFFPILGFGDSQYKSRSEMSPATAAA